VAEKERQEMERVLDVKHGEKNKSVLESNIKRFKENLEVRNRRHDNIIKMTLSPDQKYKNFSRHEKDKQIKIEETKQREME
jgi:hypothetical protein